MWMPECGLKRFVPALLGAALIVTGVVAGNWQLDRAAQKLAMQARLDEGLGRPPIDIGGSPMNPTEVEFHPARAHGTWLPDRTVLIDNKVRGGIPGYHVVTPLRLSGTNMHLLVQRGWVQGIPDRREPEIRTPPGEVDVLGELRVPGSRVFELSGSTPQGRVWQNLTLDRFREASGLSLQPVLLLQTSDADDGLVRAWDRPDLGIDKHRGYAFQWFGLALVTACFFAFFTYRNRKRTEES